MASNSLKSKSSEQSGLLGKSIGRHTRAGTNIFSRLFFLWLNPLFSLAKAKDEIEADDLETPESQHKTNILCERLAKSWSDASRKESTKVSWAQLNTGVRAFTVQRKELT